MKMKAQIIGQVFVYILAIVVVSIVLSFGYKAIKSFNLQQEQIAYVEMKNEMINLVKSKTVDFGSIEKKEISVPVKYREVCFVKSISYGGLPNPSDSIFDKYPLIRKSIEFELDGAEPKIKQNVFLIADTAEKPFGVGDITLNQSRNKFMCLPVVNNKLRLRIEGMGKYADISGWTS